MLQGLDPNVQYRLSYAGQRIEPLKSCPERRREQPFLIDRAISANVSQLSIEAVQVVCGHVFHPLDTEPNRKAITKGVLFQAVGVNSCDSSGKVGSESFAWIVSKSTPTASRLVFPLFLELIAVPSSFSSMDAFLESS